VSRETRKDFVLLAITSIAAAIGMRSVFPASRPLAWIAIGISDAYLALVLLFAAILSDDSTVATRRAWTFLIAAIPLLISRIATFESP
jgi:EamA domain-containing membrane protein RarD